MRAITAARPLVRRTGEAQGKRWRPGDRFSSPQAVEVSIKLTSCVQEVKDLGWVRLLCSWPGTPASNLNIRAQQAALNEKWTVCQFESSRAFLCGVVPVALLNLNKKNPPCNQDNSPVSDISNWPQAGAGPRGGALAALRGDGLAAGSVSHDCV